jgi:hypothetical protein
VATTNELVIKISGDIKDYQSALESAQEKTEDLENALGKIGKVSAVAFAALTAEILVSAKAFSESQAAANKLTQALQNQGIYSNKLQESYAKFAETIQDKTGIDDDALIAAQATIQALIGQTKVTEPLTQAIADLSVAKGIDLNTTAELIGKGIQGHTTALQKLGIQIDEHLDKEQRTKAIIEQVTQRFGGQAEAANKGLGSLRGLTTAFGNFQEEIGKRFSPLLEAAIKGMTSFFTELQKNQPLLDFITSLIFAGTVVAGLGTAVGIAGTAFLGLKTAMTAAGIATNAMSLATKGLLGATGIGLLAVLVAEIYLNWNTVWPRMQSVYSAFVENVSALSGGLGSILGGVFSFDLGKIKSGLAEVKTALQNGYAAATAGLKPISIGVSGGGQDKDKLAAAQAQALKEIEIEKFKQEGIQAERELALLKVSDASAQEIAIKQQEVETLKALQNQTNAEIKDALVAHLAEVRAAEDTANAISESQNENFRNTILAQNTEFGQLDASQQALFLAQNGDKLRQSLETEESIRLTYAQQQVQADIQRRNQFLADEQKFGIAYAAINQAMHSATYQGAKSAFGDLAQLQQSGNAELKAIGKAAAVANIAIKTAESAMNIYAGFSTIPIVGQVLGVAGAAAAIAFGVEQTGQVLAAADGGVVTGGIPNVDSVAARLMPGELVVPKRNFEETVSAVANQRAGVTDSDEGSGGGVAEIVLTLKDDLVNFIEAKLVERQKLNISMVGA